MVATRNVLPLGQWNVSRSRTRNTRGRPSHWQRREPVRNQSLINYRAQVDIVAERDRRGLRSRRQTMLFSPRMPSNLRDHPRIAVVGTSGAGKTTFARRLAGALSCPHIELDAYHWGPDWSIRADFVQNVNRAVEGETWVLDGNYHSVRSSVWARATAIVWLNFSFPVVFGRAIARTIGRIITREVVFDNRETWRSAMAADGIPRWVLRTYWKRRREYTMLFASPEYRHLRIFEVSSPRSAAALLTAVEATEKLRQ